MDLNRLLPPPRVQARVTAVRIEGERIVQVFGATSSSTTQREDDLTPADPGAPNYMFYRGGTLQFGKLTMADADLQVVDANPEDPLDFFLDRYYDQLVAGYTKNMPDKELVAVVPDFYRLRDPDDTRPNLTPAN